MDKDQISTLFENLLNDRCTDNELKVLFELLKQPRYEQLFRSLLEEHWDNPGTVAAELNEEKRRRMLEELTRLIAVNEQHIATTPGIEALPDDNRAQAQSPKKNILRISHWFRYAAAVLLFAGLLSYFFFYDRTENNITDTSIVAQAATVDDISPGGEKAILTLSDGRQIVLDGATNGVLAEEGNSEVVKLADGQLVYRAGATPSTGPVYNTMSTPKGGQYRLVLPDGTHIWLNAASAVTYPVAFDEEKREISIKGEAYLEVAHDKQRPFRIKVDGSEITVLGTTFNLNAYGNEDWMKTTLLEGSVKIVRDGNIKILKPGQQARINAGGEFDIVEHADVEEATAWKNGFFSFHQADIQTVMRQFERWYDIEVSYQGRVPPRKFEGELERGLQLSEMLKILDKMGVDFRLEGRQLIVYPKPDAQ